MYMSGFNQINLPMTYFVLCQGKALLDYQYNMLKIERQFDFF
jgi:hypothetical protein